VKHIFSIIYEKQENQYKIRPSSKLTVDELLLVVAHYPTFKQANQAIKSLTKKVSRQCGSPPKAAQGGGLH